MPADVRHVVDGKAFSLNQTDHAQGHILPDVEGWLRLGIDGLRDKVAERAARVRRRQTEQQIFYEAALDRAGRRHDSSSGATPTWPTGRPKRATMPAAAQELRAIAERCRRLSTEPARDFWDALQAVWFLFVLLQIESNASSFSPGRFDQYMLPYLQQDLDSRALTLEQAQDLLELLWLKFNEVVLLRSSSSARYFAGFPIGFNIARRRPPAGRDGSDGTNLLSYMCLRAQADLGMTQPNLSIRIHAGSPDEFLRAASFVIGKGSGMPQVFNDEVIIPGQINRGIAVEDAQNYAVVGCVELSTPGKALGWSDASMFNLTRVLELTLFGGRDPQTGEQIGLETPTLAEMASFDELEAAYDRQLAHFVPLMVKGCNVVDSIHAEKLPSPFLSLVIDDCIERGVGCDGGRRALQLLRRAGRADRQRRRQPGCGERGGLRCKAGSTPSRLAGRAAHRFCRARSAAAAADQPCAQVRQRRSTRVDRFAANGATASANWSSEHPTIRGGLYQPGFYTVSAHVPMGANVGATPDGRHAGTPLADGGLSPMTGVDQRGATAVLQSVAKPNLELASNGTLLNMKFLPSFFADDSALDKFVLLLRGFCRLKIPHVQFNVVVGGDVARGPGQSGRVPLTGGARGRLQRLLHRTGQRVAGRDHPPHRV